MKPVLSTPSWSWAHKTKRSGCKYGNVGLLRLHSCSNPSCQTSEKSPTYELTPLTWLPINTTGGVFLCSCDTVAHQKSLGRATSRPHVGVRTIRGASGLTL